MNVRNIGPRIDSRPLWLLLAGFLGLAQGPEARADWRNSLPSQAQASILWFGDLEEGSLYDWTYPDFQFAGGGIFNTGDPAQAFAVSSQVVAHSGLHSAEATIHSAFRAQFGNRAVRLMRWTDRPWDDGGEYFPSEAYFSTWIYFPTTYNPNKYPPWDPGDGGWWNLFQFKSRDSNGVSQPIFTFNIDHDDASGLMSFYAYSKYNPPFSFGSALNLPLPVERWVHLEAFYKQSSGQDGQVTFWQDGRKILDIENVRTILAEPVTWGIGNYTDHIDGGPVPGSATLYFDDAAVATQRLSETLPVIFRDSFETGDTRVWSNSPPP